MVLESNNKNTMHYEEEYAEEEYQNYDGYDGREEEYEWQYSASSKVPEPVRSFLTHFKKVINEGNLYDIQNAYDTYQKVSDKYYKTTSWPDADEIKPIIQKDKFFHILYKELFYRHIYARIQGGPSLDQRFESYANYCNLFNLILNTTTPVATELPNQWLWEIIDEFIYQFQSFSLYRSKLAKMTDVEREPLKANPNIWNVHGVLNVLHSLVDKSNINRQLEVYTSGGNPDSVAGEFGCHSLYKMLGYFSLVGLLRLHSLHGDYYQAIKVLENIELNKKSLYSRVPACQITTYYYVGFAYMMMRRYADAIRTFSNILLYIQRMKSMFQTRNYQNDQINKQTEKMYKLLTICLVLHPQRIDESVHSYIKEKYGDHMMKMQHQDLKEFESCFSSSCPKFLSPVPPPCESKENHDKGPFALQLKVFMEEVKQQINLPEIRSYLKLYTTMPNSKLAAFLGMNEDDYRNNILCFKHKMKNVVWTKGTSSLEGEFQSGSEVDFYIDKDMIHIADTKVAPRYGDFFIRQIHKFEEMSRTYKTPQ